MKETLLRAVSGAVVVLGHLLIAMVLVVAIWIVDRLILYLNGGREILVYDRLPLSYLFQTIDVAMIGVFGVFGVLEAIRAMRE